MFFQQVGVLAVDAIGGDVEYPAPLRSIVLSTKWDVKIGFHSTKIIFVTRQELIWNDFFWYHTRFGLPLKK